MNAPASRALNAVSVAELRRRWAAVRSRMHEQGVDALVMQNSSDWVGGYVRWFSNQPATNGYPTSVVFPRDSGMSLIEQGPFDGVRRSSPDEERATGIAVRLTTPSYPSVGYTGAYDADIAVRELRSHGARRIGLVAPAAMYHSFGLRLREALGDLDIVDFTDPVDRIKDFEIAAYAQYVGQQQGSEQGIFLCSSAPAGEAASFRPRSMQGRTLRAGDVFSLLVENNGGGGFYAELSRIFVLGKAAEELRRAHAAVLEAQRHALSLLKPGASCSQVFARHNAHLRSLNLPEERRLNMHGMGYDMVERPLIRHDETMQIAEHMAIVCHPGLLNDRMFVHNTEIYLVEADGPSESLHRTAKQIFEIH